MKQPTSHRWLFWIILGAYSTFFAEVFAGSDMFPFFNIWGILVVWPLYGLHTVLLTTIIFRRGKPTLPALVFAGMLFGLYEAYMTKVLWQPSWNAQLILADIAVVEVFVLVFWWHTWFSFITPLLLAEQQLTNSHPALAGLSGKLRDFYAGWKGWLAVLVFGGVFQSINSPSVLASLLSGVGNVGFLFLLTWLWKRVTAERQYTFNELLPNRKEFVFLSLWLSALYLFLGFSATPERIPGAAGQGIILAMYVVLILLLIRALRVSRVLTLEHPSPEFRVPDIPLQRWLLIGGAFVITLVLSRAFLGELSGVIVLVSWAGGSVVGAAMFIQSVKALLFRETGPNT